MLAGLGLFGGGLHNAMQYLGLHYTTATNGTLFFSLSPVTIMVLAGLMLGERVRAHAVGRRRGVASPACW